MECKKERYQELITNIPPTALKSKHSLIMYFAKCTLECFTNVYIHGSAVMSKFSGINAKSLDLLFETDVDLNKWGIINIIESMPNIRFTCHYDEVNSHTLTMKTENSEEISIIINLTTINDNLFDCYFIDDLKTDGKRIWRLGSQKCFNKIHNILINDALNNLKNKILTPLDIKACTELLSLHVANDIEQFKNQIMYYSLQLSYYTLIKKLEGYKINCNSKNFITDDVLQLLNYTNVECMKIIFDYAFTCSACYNILSYSDLPFVQPICKCRNPINHKEVEPRYPLGCFGIIPIREGIYTGILHYTPEREDIYSGMYHMRCFMHIVRCQEKYNICNTCQEPFFYNNSEI
jgi:hypothetical protein